MTDVTNETTQPVNQPAPSLEVVDLQNAVKVIDYACEQGAFKGWQVIEQVSAVREKLVNFLKATAPAEPTTQSAPVAETVKPAVKKAAKKTPKK